MNVSRRDLLCQFAIWCGASAASGLLVACSKGFDPADPPAPPLDFFTHEQRQTVRLMSEVIIPTTETPGAIAAGVPEFIENLLQNWYPPRPQGKFLNAMQAFLNDCETHFKTPFIQADENKRHAAVQRAWERETSRSATRFFREMKQLVLFGYYTSETGMTQERVYVPIPGRFDGNYDVSNLGGKIFSL